MTLHEVAKQVYSLTNGRVNGENYTESELENVFKIWMLLNVIKKKIIK